MEKSKSEPYNIAHLYKEIWEGEFPEKFVVLPMHYKWAKELVGVPCDTITERAKLHCRDLWHRQHCKGSLQCFVKNFNQFVDATISTKQKVSMTIHCDYCDQDFDENKYHEHLQGCKEFQAQPMNDNLLNKLGLRKV